MCISSCSYISFFLGYGLCFHVRHHINMTTSSNEYDESVNMDFSLAVKKMIKILKGLNILLISCTCMYIKYNFILGKFL